MYMAIYTLLYSAEKMWFFLPPLHYGDSVLLRFGPFSLRSEVLLHTWNSKTRLAPVLLCVEDVLSLSH